MGPIGALNAWLENKRRVAGRQYVTNDGRKRLVDEYKHNPGEQL